MAGDDRLADLGRRRRRLGRRHQPERLQGDRHGRADVVAPRQPGQRDQPCPVGEVGAQVTSHLEGQTRLAGAAGADHRHQDPGLQEPGKLVALLQPTDEGGALVGQVGADRGAGAEGREGLLQTVGLDLHQLLGPGDVAQVVATQVAQPDARRWVAERGGCLGPRWMAMRTRTGSSSGQLAPAWARWTATAASTAGPTPSKAKNMASPSAPNSVPPRILAASRRISQCWDNNAG